MPSALRFPREPPASEELHVVEGGRVNFTPKDVAGCVQLGTTTIITFFFVKKEKTGEKKSKKNKCNEAQMKGKCP